VTEQHPDTAAAAATAAEQASVREALTAARGRTATHVAGLARDFERFVEASTSVATDDEHDPEGSTIAFERAQVAALLHQERSQLRELDRALGRLRDGTYGRCERCGQPIAAQRLAARPAASTCITCATAGRR
jgi:RNA polymerase-binding transcription factor DksA